MRFSTWLFISLFDISGMVWIEKRWTFICLHTKSWKGNVSMEIGVGKCGGSRWSGCRTFETQGPWCCIHIMLVAYILWTSICGRTRRVKYTVDRSKESYGLFAATKSTNQQHVPPHPIFCPQLYHHTHHRPKSTARCHRYHPAPSSKHSSYSHFPPAPWLFLSPL